MHLRERVTEDEGWNVPTTRMLPTDSQRRGLDEIAMETKALEHPMGAVLSSGDERNPAFAFERKQLTTDQ